MYPYAAVKIGGRKCDVHRVVYEREHGPIPAGFVVHHMNDDTRDNRPENLALMEDCEHRRMHSLSNRLCSIGDCARKHWGRGLCKMHWKRQRRKAVAHASG